MKPYLIPIALFTLPLAIYAQTYNWTGAAIGGSEFANPANWNTMIANPLANNQLNFGASLGHYNPLIDDTVYRVHRLTFTADAVQSYTISADPPFGLQLTHTGWITNDSNLTHTLAADIFFNAQNPDNNQHNSWGYFYVNQGEIVWSGKAERDATTNLNVIKVGEGRLVLSGDHASSTDGMSLLTIARGEVVLDLDAGATFDSSMKVHMYPSYFGTYIPVTQAGAGGTLTIRGKSSGESVLQLGEFSHSATNNPSIRAAQRLVIDANDNSAGTQVSFSGYSAATAGTLNIDLSSSGNNRLYIPAFSGVSNNINPIVTVTSREGESVKTGFATQEGNEVVRFTGFSEFPEFVRRSGDATEDGELLTANANYSVAGVRTLNGSEGAYTVHSLTIQGSGEIKASSDPQKRYLATGNILVEEGFTGDFHIHVRLNAGDAAPYYIHQYNKQVTLYLNQGIAPEGEFSSGHDQSSLWKTGEGTVVISGDSNSLRGAIHVQEGRLELHGSFNSVNSLYQNDNSVVYAGAILAGSARFGENGSVYTNPSGQEGGRQAQIRVFAGGILDASNLNGQDAFYIAGKLELEAGAIFRMMLGANRGDALHVASSPNVNITSNNKIVRLTNSNLELELAYAPALNEIITLLTWDAAGGVTRTGQFAAINGGSFHDGNKFYLGNPLDPYEFAIFYDNTAGSVYLQVMAIPEPSTVVLLVGVAALTGAWWRRRR